MTANFNVRKMYSTIRMDGCEYSIEIMTALLKERVTRNIFFLEIHILLLKELLKQWMTAGSLIKINTVHCK